MDQVETPGKIKKKQPKPGVSVEARDDFTRDSVRRVINRMYREVGRLKELRQGMNKIHCDLKTAVNKMTGMSQEAFHRTADFCSRELFYVRNHLPVPEVDPATYELEVEGVGPETFILSLDDIKKFPKHTITATIQCAGNRRGEMSKV
uniref:Oxidoreductase molybdopterin-binding domain-containing protein n=1 Tax=Timema bartmani TaxID=61472 RepID=A0A7R9I173_9NEOP|nr:unnamed protein product [Timema bartmani]